MKIQGKAGRVLRRAWLWVVGRSIHEVSFHGRRIKLECRKRRPQISAQDYVDYNAVACGRCGDAMFPGAKVWVYLPRTPEELEGPGVLPVDVDGGRQGLLACLASKCCPTVAAMCGELGEGRLVSFFESPLQRAMRTGDVVIVPSIESYRG